MNEKVRLILWLIETREPNLYKDIQSAPHDVVKGDKMLQARTLVEEYETELHDGDLDEDCLYQKH